MYYVHHTNVMSKSAIPKTATTTSIITVSKELVHLILNTYILFTLFVCVVGREAIRPTDDVEVILQNAEVGSEVLGISVARDGPPCAIDLQRDLPKPSLPQPLYIQPGTTEWWLPNDKGIIEVPRGSSIELHCTNAFSNTTGKDEGTTNSLPYKVRRIRPTCLGGTTFTLNGEKYEFRHFSCAQHEKYTAERTTQSCANNAGRIYRIGYNLTKERFLETMQICHDADEVRTHYVRHTMDASNIHTQRGVKRLSFSKVGHFDALNMNSLYTLKNQQFQVAHLLGNDDEKAALPFVTKSHFLSRGHLAAKSDMIYATQQRTTFTFLNAAPQWQTFNAGQWATLENQVRAFVAKTHLEVICYTGTWGIIRLNMLNDNIRRQFYLTTDANNNGLLPVPALYYRVIVALAEGGGGGGIGHEKPKSGIALVGVNNPHATLSEIIVDYVLCEDVHEQVPWLSWMQNREDNLKKGYLYACRVDEFVKVVTTLPAELANVTELLV